MPNHDKKSSWEDPDFWDKSNLWEDGMALFKKIGDLGLGLELADLAQFDPRLVHYIVQFQYGAILNRPNLTAERRMLCAIAALLPIGDAEGVEAAINSALDAGAAKEAIITVVLQTGCFAGFRKWALGARLGLKVFRERGLISEDPADDEWQNPETWNKEGLWAQGWETRDLIAGGANTPTSMPQQARFDPLQPHYVIEFRFGEVTSRPGLDMPTRQLCTLATFLATGEEFAAEGAMNGALNVGATREEIIEVVLQTGTLCGFPKWAIGSRVGVRVFEERGLIPPIKGESDVD